MQTPHDSSIDWIWQQAGWPALTWREDAIAPALTAARQAQGRVQGMAGLLDGSFSSEAIASILVEDGLTTSAIEGERLNPDAVRSSVARQLGLPHAGLPAPDRHVEGLTQLLLDATRHYDAPLTLERLCGWQAGLFPDGYSGLQRIRTGALRGDAPMQVVSGGAGRERVHFTAPPRSALDAQLADFLAWFGAEPYLDGLVRAGIAHLWFVTLHPFEDGNGRLTRALTDMAIAQDERQPMRLFSLSAQLLREREAYYTLLERSQRGGLDVTDWLIWFLEQIRLAANASEQTIAHTLAKARFWQRHAQTHINERQRKLLNRLLDAGVEGFEGGITTRKYVSLTRCSRATAFRELTDLVEKGLLQAVEGRGRSAGYEVRFS
ncbi:Fic family protein [Uliginosibacterium flavum]|uniref:Fic family protein n=1 Tax=Uliginosibacterium flavum TaxID=1396831 RepID=A0ABV2TPK0_9RHOO